MICEGIIQDHKQLKNLHLILSFPPEAFTILVFTVMKIFQLLIMFPSSLPSLPLSAFEQLLLYVCTI